MPVPLYPMYLETPYSFKYTNLTPAITNCTGGVVWIHKVLGECVLTNRQYASVICGLVSLLIWMTVGFPQIYKNCRNPAGLEGLSLLFVIQWLLGDSTNLIGCILTEQLPVQTYTAVYYVSADLVLLSQIIYFKTKKHYQKKEQEAVLNNSPGDVPRIILCISGIFAVSTLWALWGHDTFSPDPPRVQITRFPAGRTLLAADQHNLKHTHIFKGALDITGYVIGVISASFYVGARVAQIYRNWSRKSTEGVALFMFLLAVLGNLFYGLAVFLQSTDVVFIIRHLPWIIGSLGIMGFDLSNISLIRRRTALWWVETRQSPGETHGHPLLPERKPA